MQKEQIALFDATGHPIGAKDRAAAYRGKDRVGLCFVWAAWPAPDGAIRTLLQTRSRPGDPYLGSLDSPAAKLKTIPGALPWQIRIAEP